MRSEATCCDETTHVVIDFKDMTCLLKNSQFNKVKQDILIESINQNRTYIHK